MSLTNKVAQFDADSDLVNAWVHGGPTTSITTDSGPVRSPAKLIADLNTSINIEADGILAQVEAVAASINVVAERADAIAAIDADVAEVQAYKIAGKVLIDSDVAALDAYRVAGQNLINEDTAALDAYRVAGQALIDADVGAVETRKIEALFTDIPAAILTMQAYNERGAWNTGVAYAVKDVYVDAGIAYVVLLAHTSTSVAADLAAGKVAIHQGVTREELQAEADSRVWFENLTNITTNHSVKPGFNAMAAGPVTIDVNVLVNVPSGSTLTIV